ncbi:MAG: putative TetR family transcriptional regulator [Verrucomicrobiaceae bacterium]|nr:putative TetR family transcriptional regulator [Verrucomicrobiaceae bacterium]
MVAKNRGRPRKSIDAELLNAAAEEFLAHGYEAANIDTIAAAAASTKPALYRRYSSKKTLFEAAMLHLAKDFEIDLSYLTDEKQTPEDVLLELAQFFHRHIGSAKVLAMSRLLIIEGVRFPTLTVTLRKTVMQSYLPYLIEYFERLNQAGLTRIGDTTEASVIFTTLTGGPFERLLGVKIKRAEVTAHLIELVRFFLAGYGYQIANKDGDAAL